MTVERGDSEHARFRIGGEERECLQVEVLGRSLPQSDDYWDGNWLEAQVTLAAGGFKGRYRASLRAEEFAGFRDGLRRMQASLDAGDVPPAAEFVAMEEQLSLRVEGDRRGRFTAACVAADAAGTGNRLEFALEFDLSGITTLLKDLDVLIAAFPVKDDLAGKVAS